MRTEHKHNRDGNPKFSVPHAYVGDGRWHCGRWRRRGYCNHEGFGKAGTRLNVEKWHSRKLVGTTSNGLLARLALPDADSLTLDVVLAAEHASVL